MAKLNYKSMEEWLNSPLGEKLIADAQKAYDHCEEWWDFHSEGGNMTIPHSNTPL